MTWSIKKIQPNIGAVIENIALPTLTKEDIQKLHSLLLQHEVLCFRNQPLTARQQMQLAQTFGSLHIHPIFPSVPNQPEVIILDSHQQDLRDNELWHTDVTFSQTPPLGCILQAIKTPSSGGDTLWASGTAAYQNLPDKMKQRLKNLWATHNIQQSFPIERYAHSPYEQEKLQDIFNKNPPVQHPVVRLHPVTQQPCLFVSEGFTTHIQDVSDQESKELLTFLFQHITQEQFSLRWKWQQNDIVIWDNRSTQHKALFDYGTQHRVMHRVTINGSRPYGTSHLI